MEGADALPLWVQIFIAIVTAVISAIGGIAAYKKNIANPTVPMPSTQAIVTGIGASLSDRQSSQDLVAAVYAVAHSVNRGTEELERLRKEIKQQTETMVEEHARLRSEAAEIRRHLIDERP